MTEIIEEDLLYYSQGINYEHFDEICHHLYYKGPVEFGCSISRVETWTNRIQAHFRTWLSVNTSLFPYHEEIEMWPHKEEHSPNRLRLEWNPVMETNADAKRLLESNY